MLIIIVTRQNNARKYYAEKTNKKNSKKYQKKQGINGAKVGLAIVLVALLTFDGLSLARYLTIRPSITPLAPKRSKQQASIPAELVKLMAQVCQ